MALQMHPVPDALSHGHLVAPVVMNGELCRVKSASGLPLSESHERVRSHAADAEQFTSSLSQVFRTRFVELIVSLSARLQTDIRQTDTPVAD